MNPIAKMLIDMAKFYSYELEERQLEMYVGVLSQFPTEVVLQAGRDYVHNLKNTRFPIPPHSILSDQIAPASSVDLAKEAAGRVIQAVAKFGWPNGRQAKEFIGELGWRGVERFGGWPTICEGLGTTISPDTFYAQLRDMCLSTLELNAAGINDQPVAIGNPGDRSMKVSTLISELATKKTLPGGTDG